MPSSIFSIRGEASDQAVGRIALLQQRGRRDRRIGHAEAPAHGVISIDRLAEQRIGDAQEPVIGVVGVFLNSLNALSP